MPILHDPRRHRVPSGALALGKTVVLSCEAAQPVKLTLFTPDGTKRIPMAAAAPGLFSAAFTPNTIGLYHYAFDADGEDDPARDRHALVVYDPAFLPPRFLDAGGIYHIFVDRFCMGKPDLRAKRSDVRIHASWHELPEDYPPKESEEVAAIDFFGGNLNGIREKLGDLHGLGMRALYLSPIFTARSNHKYDTIDHFTIDPMFGTEADFRALCAEAGALGMRIILDGVFAHLGDAAPQFDRADTTGIGTCHHATSPFADWFLRDEDGDFKYWWGVKTLPALNLAHPPVRAHLIAAALKWLDAGASGWRLDVADELPMDFLRELRAAIRERHPGALLIGEVWENAAEKISYGQLRSYVLGDTLDGVMNYPLRDALIAFFTGNAHSADTADALFALYQNYPSPFARCLMNLISSHDCPRIVNALCQKTGEGLSRRALAALSLSEAEKAAGRRLVRLMWAALCFCPGVPTLYYGDEAGLEGGADPFNRKPLPSPAPAFLQDDIAALLSARRALFDADAPAAFFAPHPDVLIILRGGAAIAINRADVPLRVGVPLEGRWETQAGHTAPAHPNHVIFDLLPEDFTILRRT